MDISPLVHKNASDFGCVVYYDSEGTMSQIFDLGLTFCFIKSGKLSLKKMTKSYLYFLNKTKTKA